MEVYGSETLPVLIQLPDLTRSKAEQPATSLPKSESRDDDWNQLEEPEAAVAAAGDDSDLLLADTVAAVASASTRTDAEALVRTPLRMRRKMQMRQSDGWLPGLRRFLVATVIAAVLFAVIITIKEWNQTPAPQARSRTMAVEAPSLDLGPPELNAAGILPYDSHPALLRPDSEPALGSDETLRSIDPREIDPEISSGEYSVDAPPISPPGSTSFGSFDGASARERAQALPSPAAGVVDGVAPTATSAAGYPSTGVDGMPDQSVGSGPRLPGTVSPQPVWNAERAPADGRFPQR